MRNIYDIPQAYMPRGMAREEWAVMDIIPEYEEPPKGKDEVRILILLRSLSLTLSRPSLNPLSDLLTLHPVALSLNSLSDHLSDHL